MCPFHLQYLNRLLSLPQNGDLMRLAIASPGNDFRLGACEAPPAIISMYLGNDLSEFLEGYIGECLVCLSPSLC